MALPKDRVIESSVQLMRSRGERERPTPSSSMLASDEITGRFVVIPGPPRTLTPKVFVSPVAGRADRATLTLLRGPEVGSTFSLERGETILGRGAAANILVDEPSVSRCHARIAVDGTGRHFIEDLDSTNGTFVCGRRVRRATLSDGDRLQIGSEYAFRFAMLDREEETLRRRLYESSMRDSLTGLLNRRSLLEHLVTEVERATRERSELGVLMIDVDHFKTINDTFGHAAGDRTLRAIALAATRGLRGGDLLARYGGEELTVLARGAGREAARALAERMRGAAADVQVDFAGHAIQVTVSIGVGWLSECTVADGLELLARADARLYCAKAAGRNRVCAD